MKKILLLSLAFTISFNNFGQLFSDNFDSYAVGSYLGPQSLTWSTWSGAEGGAEDATITTAQSSSNPHSIYFSSTAANGGPQDVVLKFGQLYNSGIFTLQNKFYVNTAKKAYYNIQGALTIGNLWALNVSLDAGSLIIDDGITSKGIRVLVAVMKKLGDVVVVAPDSPQSGMGHAITIGQTLRLYEDDIFDNVKAYKSSGTPADCVKLAKHHVLKDHKPDLVVSGINHGSNTSISVLYSGTMSAAIEGALEGYPSIGFSLCDFSSKADFSHVEEWVEKIARQVLENGIPKGIALNVNIPPKRNEEIRGVKICRQADAKWQEEFVERFDPTGRKYFWLAGNFVNFDKGEDNDEWAIANNYISIVPCQYDLTAHHAISHINKEWDWTKLGD